MNIGSVVTLKSNGLIPLSGYNFLSLGGNEKFSIPLMVVVEVLFGTQIEYDEESGAEKASFKGKNQYKCVYFSDKSMKLEENWFFENELAVYGSLGDKVHKNENVKNIKWGDIVRFKTTDEEAKKIKSFNNETEFKGQKSLVAYTSPAFLVTGFANIDKKESIVDPISGKKKRDKSSKLVKCKFFNLDSDKFSEQIIPIECLQKIDNSRLESNLTQIANFLSINSFIIVEVSGNKFFGKVKSTHVYSGRYQLVFYNELHKNHELIWLDEILNFIEIDLTRSTYYPGIHDVSGESKLIDIKGYISTNRANLRGVNFKIVYQNLKGEIISRYISIKEVSVEIEEKYYYLKSYCYLRNAEREFRSDRILSIRTIENQDLLDLLELLKG
ncbi:MAG: hypothetical protein MUC81_10350 [Bacteroidia bacterium]|jgi:hypothetical protein|nr:hypothetical protein [Bacteroidia bacterium]